MVRRQAFLLPILAAAYTAAHGFVSQVIIDGTDYAGNLPAKYEGASPIRMISTIDPVKGADNSNINCGMGAELAEIVAPASPGSNVTFQWTGGADGGENWPHTVGPLMTYMASCGSVSCSEFNGSTAEWFKIDEIGMKGQNSWYQADIADGDSYTITLPQNINPGGYLIRHEIISLQQAVSVGGAEFYVSCTQVQMGGSSSGTPNDTVAFPGGYSDTDPGIYVPDLFDPSFTDYVFPGPPVSNLAYPGDGEITPALTASATYPSGTAIPSYAPAGSGGASSPMETASGTGGASGPAETGSAAGTTQGGTGTGRTCSLRSNPSSSPVALSRRFHEGVMRRLRRSVLAPSSS
ncbi:uncharacterized protein FIBRA_01962 [Fibroporia radiculosa]|uniref:AA9 family lytic polysaccharide monooxygenase n=1 Tax=Fibroporia radiculosa TaxID=599839 RepID=J4HU60_9APHY|nr:uncharacterized protein FIBRA_01962 [Fibroporia radiculosa]CCL99937.1 predicted protein [Fibroporia radiculosa]